MLQVIIISRPTHERLPCEEPDIRTAAHTPFRRALERTLKPTRLRRLEDILEARAEIEFLPVLDQGYGDFCQSLMARFPAWAETEWLNLDADVAPRLADRAAKW